MTTQTTRLSDGDSYSWEFPTGAVSDVAVTTSQQPLDVDIEEKLPGEPDSEYSRVEQLSTFFSGPKTVTETGTKTLTIPTDGVVIRVTVTNNSGSPVTPQVSVTPADQREIFYEDGRAMVDAKQASAESFKTADLELDEKIYYAASDAELDTKLSDASNGDLILLGNGEFSKDRTISKKLRFQGIFSDFDGTLITGNWTLSGAETTISHVRVDGPTVTCDSVLVTIESSNILNATIDINASDCGVTECFGGTVDFDSGVTGGIVDSCRDTSVTGNTTDNTVGTIS